MKFVWVLCRFKLKFTIQVILLQVLLNVLEYFCDFRMDYNERQNNRYRRATNEEQDLLRIGLVNAARNSLGRDDSQEK